MHKSGFERTRLACYSAYFTMSSVFCLPPMLFLTFHRLYGISYTLLGTLVLTNFVTQLTVDLIFTAFSGHFNVKKVVRVMPLITALGLGIYGVFPVLFPGIAYVGLLLGTVIFSVAAGLSEVLVSPVIAAIPSKDPQRDMSLLHSLFAFGVLTVVSISTLYLNLFGDESWLWLCLFWACMPVIASVLFFLSPMPELDVGGQTAQKTPGKAGWLALCALCIFFGSCAENVMSSWISGFVEGALRVDKTVGDLLGTAMFAVLLGLVRIGYAKFGKRIVPVLLVGMVGAAACYLMVSLTGGVLLPFVACVLAGAFTSMLWPGTLIMMEEKLPHAGVAAYALMAACGDLGASVAPQLMGIVVDTVSVTPWAADLGGRLGLSPEQLGMKTGMLVSSLFPMLGIVVLVVIHFYSRRKKT